MTDDERKAEAIANGEPADVKTIGRLANDLRSARKGDLVAWMLTAVGRKALGESWARQDSIDLAMVLKAHNQFGYARRILGRVRAAGDSEYLRQQHALCTYKDRGLPAARRLARARQILDENKPTLDETTSSETLGIGGAIYKRMWQVGARRADLESARFYYRAGYDQTGDPDHWYAGINAALMCDQLARLEDGPHGTPDAAKDFRDEADAIREDIVKNLPAAGTDSWSEATLGEAFFGLGRFEEARAALEEFARHMPDPWTRETTAMQLGELARVRDIPWEAAEPPIRELLGAGDGAVRRAYIGKVGLALSGGGFRASLFHLGVLARLAQRNMLRHVEVLSCVSGGSIVGAFYYLRLLELLEKTPDGEVSDSDYVKLVEGVARDFFAGVGKDVRNTMLLSWRPLLPGFTRTQRAAQLYDSFFYSKIEKGKRVSAGDGWRMPDLKIRPAGREDGFSLADENWLRAAKVPILVINSTTLNTGHTWQFTASWMGEPPTDADEQVDAVRRLRRVYYSDAPTQHQEVRLSTAVGASACVPMVFPPIVLKNLYKGDKPDEQISVALVDGGVHDNQGIASLLDQDCTTILVSDASGQINDADRPKRWFLPVALRAQTVLMSRVRGQQISDLTSRLRSETVRGLMVVHMMKGLPAGPRDWVGCQEPYTPEDDALPPGIANQRPAYGITPRVQRALARMRTDLDKFSADEAYGLMAAGYAMTRVELARILELPDPEKKLEDESQWPFAAMLGRFRNEADEPALLASLVPGKAQWGRRTRRWLMRRKLKAS